MPPLFLALLLSLGLFFGPETAILETTQPEAEILFSEDDVMRQRLRLGFARANRRVLPLRADEYAEYLVAYGRMCRVDPFLLGGILLVESRGDERARSRVAFGLMQINWTVHENLIRNRFPFIQTLEDALIPRNNLLVGSFLFRRYLTAEGENERRALYRYFGAPSDAYVLRVFAARDWLRNLDLPVLAQITLSEDARGSAEP